MAGAFRIPQVWNVDREDQDLWGLESVIKGLQGMRVKMSRDTEWSWV